MNSPSDLESAIGWIRAQAAETHFGHIGVEFVISDGRITRVITKQEISYASIPTGHRGQGNGATR